MIRNLLEKFDYECDAETPGADDPKRVGELEQKLGKSLPADYREFLLQHAPGDFNKNVEFGPIEPNPWLVGGRGQINGFFGFEKKKPNDIVAVFQNGEYPEKMFAVAWGSGGNKILMAMDDPPGRIYFHESDSDTVFLCANSFTEFLESFVIVKEATRIKKLIKKLGICGFNDRPGAYDSAKIPEFEKRIGTPLPDDYREFLLLVAPCQCTENVVFRPLEPNPWLHEGLGQIDGFYGIDNERGDDIAENYESARFDIPGNFFPIGWDSGANHMLMAFDKPVGRIYFHDRDSGDVFLCANSFTEFLESFEIVSEE